AFFDAGRRIAYDVVEAVLLQFVEYAADAFLRQRVLVARLRGRQHVQVVVALVADQRLLQRGFFLDHVDEVVHHAAFAAHDEIEVAQADVEIDDGGLVAALRKAGCERGGRRGLADAALAGSDDDGFGQGNGSVVLCVVNESAARRDDYSGGA